MPDHFRGTELHETDIAEGYGYFGNVVRISTNETHHISPYWWPSSSANMAIKTVYKHQAHYTLSWDKRILVISHQLNSSSFFTTQLQICTRENNKPLGQPLGPKPVVTKSDRHTGRHNHGVTLFRAWHTRAYKGGKTLERLSPVDWMLHDEQLFFSVLLSALWAWQCMCGDIQISTMS